MGRRVRMVPPNWEHPKNELGHYKPLLEGPFSKELADWIEAKAQWEKGFRSDYKGGWVKKDDTQTYPYEQWDGERPVAEDYMPEFEPSTATLFCMYEDTSEGTPISPAFETPEELARWLVDNKASSFGSMTATYEQWLPICKGCFAPSMAIHNGRIMSGVEAMSETSS